MNKSTYQLSTSGIEKVQRFKQDIASGDVSINPEHYTDGSVCYYTVRGVSASTCCFVSTESEIIDDLHSQIENTLKGDIEKRYMSHDRSYVFFTIVNGGMALNREDITTPAQRALESHANKLN